MPRRKKRPTVIEEDKTYKCCTCGREYAHQKGNFLKTNSPLWKSNDYYMPVCTECVGRMYEEYKNEYGNRDDAIYRLCMMFDIYYTDVITAMLSAAKRTYKNPMVAYISKNNLSQSHFTTFDDTLREEKELKESPPPEPEPEPEIVGTEDSVVPEYKVTKTMLAKWGDAWDAANGEYQKLEAQYKSLTGSIQDWGNAIETIKSLCELSVLKDRALRDKDIDMYTKLLDQYQKRYKDAGFKVIQQEQGDMDSQPLGVMEMVVEKICPTEYYKDKKLFVDEDGIGEYWKRFIIRPFRNLFTGSTDEDAEFSIKDGDEE